MVHKPLNLWRVPCEKRRTTTSPPLRPKLPDPGLDFSGSIRYTNCETQALRACPLSEARVLARAFVFSAGPPVTYFAYLDEFGHIGPYVSPYVSRQDSKHNDSPVFGLAGFILPSERVRGFGTWFFQRKCQLLSYEIQRSGKHPAQWEKKGSSLYTVKNVHRYQELRHFTNRLLNNIRYLGGFIFYVGIRKTKLPDAHNPNKLQQAILHEAMKQIDQFCKDDCQPSENFLLILDDHDQRSELITKASQNMYGGEEPKARLIEPPFHLESHRYQTLQAADWIAGLVGRLGAYWADPVTYSDNQVFHQYFENRLKQVSIRSSVRMQDATRVPKNSFPSPENAWQ